MRVAPADGSPVYIRIGSSAEGHGDEDFQAVVDGHGTPGDPGSGKAATASGVAALRKALADLAAR